MKSMSEFLRYQYKQYALSAKYVVPLIGLFAVFGVMYSITPIAVVTNFAIMSLVLFMIMVGIGMSCQELEPEVSEQIIILRMQSERKYYIGQVLFSGLLSGMVTVLSLCCPVIFHYLHKKMLFTRNIQASDIIGGFLLMFACSFVGCMVGGIFSPRVIRERKMGTALTIICALVSVVRIGILDEFPISKYFLWIIPPISDMVRWFMREEYFQMGKVMEAFFILMAYGSVLAIIKIELSKFRKFS
ncbi:MAG: hypothetical protein HDR27_07965 [Lachnospiraceae bacterium]|nr:hypothetical protein [Lachnospiraceae bacterium]